MTIKHNQFIPREIRLENEEYNRRWIVQNEMIGESIVSLEELDVDEEKKLDSSPFMVVWLRNIDRLFNLCNDIDLGQYDLIDVGCGSGISTAYIYGNYSLKSVMGFDFSPSLIDLAHQNKKRTYSWKDSLGTLTEPVLSFEVADATTFRVPNQNVLLFLFNPFGWATLESFIENNGIM